MMIVRSAPTCTDELNLRPSYRACSRRVLQIAGDGDSAPPPLSIFLGTGSEPISR